MYSTVVDANTYFDGRLYSTVWSAASTPDKTKAMEQATRIIDRLNFAGEKHAAHIVRFGLTGRNDFEISLTLAQQALVSAAGLTQATEFPRGDDTEPQADIFLACYEIAIALLDGVNPDEEFNDLGVVSEGYSSVRTTYDRTTVPEHTNAGIPSATAWRYLKPYLRSGHGVKLSRV